MRAIYGWMMIGLGGVACGQGRRAADGVEALYAQHCANCHGANFEGGQGGSLVDGEWKHGGSDNEIFRSVAKGFPELGMIGYDELLSDEQIRGLVILMQEKEREFEARGMEFPVPSPDEVTGTALHDYRIEMVVESGLRDPWALAFLPDGRRLVTEKSGRLRVLEADGTLDPEPIRGTPAVIEHGQGGLMEVAPHPDFEDNGWIYLAFSDGTREGAGRGQVRCTTSVVRGRIRDGEWVDQEWIYRPEERFRGGSGVHFGSRIVFQDGYVFFVIGERGGMMQSQDLSRPNGKIFRLHDDGRVPEDNPFVDRDDAIPGIWTYGHRNPQGLAIDPRDGAIFSTEHGPRGGDELNLIEPGLNYGWPVITYGMNYNGTPMTALTEKEGMEQPVIYWTPSIAACGLAFYTGERFPEWRNDLFAGGLASQELRRLRLEDGEVVDQEIVLKGIGRVRDVREGPDGYLYLVLNGPDRIVRMVPAGE